MVDYTEVRLYTVDGSSNVVLLSNTVNHYAIVAFSFERAVNTPSHVLKMKCSTSGLNAAAVAAGFALPAVKQRMLITYYTGGVGTIQFDGFITNHAGNVIFTDIEAMGCGLYMAGTALSHEVTTATTTHAIAHDLIEMVDYGDDDKLVCTDLATSTTTVGDTVPSGKRKYKAEVQSAVDLVQNLSMASIGHAAQPMWVFIQDPIDRTKVVLVNRGTGHDGAHSTAQAVSQTTGIVGKVGVTAASIDDVYNELIVRTAVGDYNTTESTPALTTQSRVLYGVRSKLLSVQEFYDIGQKGTAYGSAQQLAEGVLSFSMTPTTVLKFKCKHDALTDNGEYIVNQVYNVTDEMTANVYTGVVCVSVKHSWPQFVDEVEMVSQGLGEVTFTEADSEFTYRVEQLEQYTANRNVMCLAQANDYYFTTSTSTGDLLEPGELPRLMLVPFENVSYDYGQCFTQVPPPNKHTVFIAPVSGLYHFDVLLEIESFPMILMGTAEEAFNTLQFKVMKFPPGGGSAIMLVDTAFWQEKTGGRTARQFPWVANVMLEKGEFIVIAILVQGANGVERT